MTVMREVRRAAFEQHSVRVVFHGERGHVCKMGGNVGTASKSSCTVTKLRATRCPWNTCFAADVHGQLFEIMEC